MRGMTGKRIIIVGGANGIGAATAERLVEESAIALIGDIDTAALDVTVSRLREKGDAHGFVFDVADPAAAPPPDHPRSPLPAPLARRRSLLERRRPHRGHRRGPRRPRLL